MSAVLKLYLDLFLLFLGPILLLGGIMVCVYAIITKNYKETEYYKATHIPYLQMRFDKGRSGEYDTYKYLKALPGKKQYLFNCYIPKEDGAFSGMNQWQISAESRITVKGPSLTREIFMSAPNRPSLTVLISCRHCSTM